MKKKLKKKVADEEAEIKKDKKKTVKIDTSKAGKEAIQYLAKKLSGQCDSLINDILFAKKAPAPGVYYSVLAVLALLGHKKKDFNKWSKTKKLLSSVPFGKKILEYSSLTPQTIGRFPLTSILLKGKKIKKIYFYNLILLKTESQTHSDSKTPAALTCYLMTKWVSHQLEQRNMGKNLRIQNLGPDAALEEKEILSIEEVFPKNSNEDDGNEDEENDDSEEQEDLNKFFIQTIEAEPEPEPVVEPPVNQEEEGEKKEGEENGDQQENVAQEENGEEGEKKEEQENVDSDRVEDSSAPIEVNS
jgi:hypothetical protein